MAAHYVLATWDNRKRFYVSEAPAGFGDPWISGPELSCDSETSKAYRGKGPHHGGFHKP